jgi:hypothetical protein
VAKNSVGLLQSKNIPLPLLLLLFYSSAAEVPRLVRINEELLERKSSGSGIGN